MDRIKAEITTILSSKERYISTPVVAAAGPGRFLLLHHDSPMRDPVAKIDPESSLVAMYGPHPAKPDPKTRRIAPRHRCGGYYPSATPLTDDKVLIIDNTWYVYNWLGEMDVQIVEKHDWVTLMRGAVVITADFSTGRLRFGKPHRVTSLHYPLVFSHDTPLVEPDGSILCPVDYDILSIQVSDRPWETVLLRSPDLGETWELHGEIHLQKNNESLPQLHRPSVRKRSDGSFICILCSNEENPRMFVSVSEDGGHSWTTPEDLGFTGFDQSLLTLDGDRLLLLYRSADESPRIMARLSEDGGKSWPDSAVRLLYDSALSSDCGQPKGLLLDDGSVFVTFHSHIAEPDRAIIGAQFNI